MGLKAHKFGTHPFDTTYDVIDSATLQCTDLKKGSNKFYQMELHKNASGYWRIFTANGRTGSYSTQLERMPEDETAGRAEYAKIFRTKTTRKSQPYTKVDVVNSNLGTDAGNQVVQSDDFDQKNITVADTGKKNKSKKVIPIKISQLVSRLYSEAGNACKSQLHGSVQASEENPLGTLTKTQIEDGRAILQEANAILVADATRIDSIESEVIAITDKFYSTIPQEIALRPKTKAGEDARDDWMRGIALNNATILDDKFDLLDLLGDVKGMMGGFATTDEEKRLKEANCEFSEVDSATFKQVCDLIVNTQSKHHNWKLNPRRIFSMKSKSQSSHKKTMGETGNCQELFLGSGSQNILGICKRGILIRPPGVYITGALLGNGAYFANNSTKSSQYSTGRFGGSGSSNGNTSFMFVANVALGKVKKLSKGSSSIVKAPNGFDSVMGAANYTDCGWSKLLHDEFVVYDVKQHTLDYLIEFEQSYR